MFKLPAIAVCDLWSCMSAGCSGSHSRYSLLCKYFNYSFIFDF